jgi:CheY-like chemotaxis protein
MEQRTVLVVDDDAAIRSLISELLLDDGYTVLEADCGREALRLADEHALTVVLVDHRLPDMSGMDVLERLRTRSTSRYTPVILVSGLTHQLLIATTAPTASWPSRLILSISWIRSTPSHVTPGLASPRPH